MKTVLISAPEATPVSVEELKTHCRITIDDDDDYVEALLNASVVYLEGVMGRKFIKQTWKLLLDNWPGGAEIVLPFGNCIDVDSVIYKDRDGTPIEWAEASYVVDTESVPGRVVIAYDESWPSDVLFNVNPIAVTFDTGYGTAGENVPEALRHAVKILVCHWYENREVIVTGSIVANIPKTVDALIWPHRLF